jgi:lysyl-tRNA synthetase class 2
MYAVTWQPTCSMNRLRQRAELLAQVREFFRTRAVLEVETPLLCAATATDPYLSSVQVVVDAVRSELSVDKPAGLSGDLFFLQTSPEFAMKRLLAAGSGPIYQICKAFRNGERGRRHNPEFTMLEWYRPDFDEVMLMDEVEALLKLFLRFERAERVSYRKIFETHLKIDPFTLDDQSLREMVQQTTGIRDDGFERDTFLELLFSHIIEPRLGLCVPCFVYDYPASQAALAEKKTVGDVEVGSRFELYIGGAEIANGYFELTNAEEQRARFLDDIAQRQREGLFSVPIDERLLAAIAAGLPVCSGVALGLDRLLMQITHANVIDEVITFPIEKA